MNVFLWGAIAALVGVGYFVWQWRESKSQYARLVTTETSSTAMIHELSRAAADAAGPGAFAELVEVQGTALPGPRGLLTSEISETACLWHKHQVTRKYRDVDYDKDGNRRVKTKTEKLSGSQTKDPLVVRDADGEITVIPTATVKGARKSVDEFREPPGGERTTDLSIGSFSLSLPSSGDGDTLGFQYEEWVLLPDTKVFVAGEATDRDGELVIKGPPGADKLIISTRSEASLTESARSTSRRNQLFAGLALVAAVGLAVIGFLTL